MQASTGLNWDDDKVLDETADMVARLAMMAADGTPHGNPYYPSKIGYPTRRRVSDMIRTALTPVPDAEEDHNRGFDLDTVFSAAWDRVDADPGDDEEAKALLMACYTTISERLTPPGGGRPPFTVEEVIEVSLGVLASFDPESLWVRAVQSAYPDHPQTPGSDGWNAAEAKGNPHESVGNPWTRRR